MIIAALAGAIVVAIAIIVSIKCCCKERKKQLGDGKVDLPISKVALEVIDEAPDKEDWDEEEEEDNGHMEDYNDAPPASPYHSSMQQNSPQLPGPATSRMHGSAMGSNIASQLDNTNYAASQEDQQLSSPDKGGSKIYNPS